MVAQRMCHRQSSHVSIPIDSKLFEDCDCEVEIVREHCELSPRISYASNETASQLRDLQNVADAEAKGHDN